MSKLPWLALDVDGVLALLGAEGAAQRTVVVDGVPLVVGRGTPERLRALAGEFRLVWSSSWGRRASEALAPLLAGRGSAVGVLGSWKMQVL